MTDTPNLGLPLIAADQAQKHVTHNEDMMDLDALVQLTVIATQDAPPASPGPDEGNRYIVGTGSGDWEGKDNQVAYYDSGAWVFFTPRTGWRAFDIAANEMKFYYEGSPGGWQATYFADNIREKLTGARTYYVNASTGSDTNNGLSSGAPFATIGAAMTAIGDIDLGVFDADVVVADGTYQENVVLPPIIGTGTATLTGNVGTPKNVDINPAAGAAIDINFSAIAAQWVLTGVYANGVTYGIDASAGGSATLQSVALAASGALIFASNNARIDARTASIDIETGANRFIVASDNATVLLNNATVTLVPSSPLADFAQFILSARSAAVRLSGAIFVGAATGVQYKIDSNAVIDFDGTIPGDEDGVLLNGGRLITGDAFGTIVAASENSALSGVYILEEELSGLSGATVDSSINIPDRAIVFCVSVRTTTTITGATSFDCGVAGETAKFGGSLGIAADSTNLGVIGPTAYYAATPIRLTANGSDFTGGAVRIAIHYFLPQAPQS